MSWQVLKPGDWTDHLTSALTTLRCRLLDSNILGDVPCPSLIKFVQPPSAGGILDALVAAAMSGGNDARHAWWGKVKGLTAAERRHLRAFLLQTKWFTGKCKICTLMLQQFVGSVMCNTVKPMSGGFFT